MTSRRLLASLAVAAVLLAGTACGRDEPVEKTAPPPKVPDAIIPTSLSGGAITLQENVAEETIEAFANGGRLTLIADGRLWELREGARLIGALQVSTVVDRIDLSRPADRRSMLRQVLPGNLNELVIDEVPVWAAESNDKIVYVWFATDTFEVLQLKGSKLDPEAILNEVIKHQKASEDFLPLPPEAYEEV